METKLDRETRRVELVETSNISRSIRRIKSAGGWDGNAQWKRAIVHAMAIAGAASDDIRAVREALKLP